MPHEHLERLGSSRRTGNHGRAVGPLNTITVGKRTAQRHVDTPLPLHFRSGEAKDTLGSRIPIEDRVIGAQDIAADWHRIHQFLQDAVLLRQIAQISPKGILDRLEALQFLSAAVLLLRRDVQHLHRLCQGPACTLHEVFQIFSCPVVKSIAVNLLAQFAHHA